MAMENLLQNQLFLSMLSGAGQAISAGEPISTGLNPIIQNAIGAKSKADLQSKYLQQLLAGGAKFTFDNKKFSITGEPSMLESINKTNAKMDSVQPQPVGDVAGEISKLKDPNNNLTALQSILNPSTSPLDDLSYADLAGLTSQDVSQALQGASDVLYKKALIQESQQRVEAMKAPPVPKDTRTATIKNYEYAKEQGYEGSLRDFTADAETTHKRDYDEAVAGGYKGSFHEWMLEMARAGAINLGELVERKKAITAVETADYFTDPSASGLSAHIDKYIESENVQNQLLRYTDDPVKRTRMKNELTIKFIEDKVTASGAVIEDVKLEEGIMTWIVKFPDGTKKRFSYGIRP